MFRLPSTADVVRQALEELTPEQRDAIELVKRDVREHPRLYALLAS